ncbi:hypothetical protein N7540_011144 [Penicillium herquei]|nr:hypothetical protein N7540_011144 [Penicillium herquei]
MSFGWSAGDIASAVKLVKSIISSLNNTTGAREEFRELESELLGLESALERIDSLTLPACQLPEIQVLKFVTCSCIGTLERFHKRVQPFEGSLSAQSKMKKLRAAPRMVRWELLLKKDLPDLRQYLVGTYVTQEVKW